MYEIVNQPIDMIAIFGKEFNDIKPVKFKWNNKDFIITKIGYKHKVRDGRKIVHVFSVTDGSNFFELRFDANDVAWQLGRTWDGEAN